MAEQTVSSFLVVALFGEEAPIDWHAPWIADYCSPHTPKQHRKKEVKGSKSEDIEGRLAHEHVPIYKDKVVETDEEHHAREVRVHKFCATDFPSWHLNIFLIVIVRKKLYVSVTAIFIIFIHFYTCHFLQRLFKG